MQAYYIELLGVGVAKNFKMDVGYDFGKKWSLYYKANNLLEIDRLYGQYNSAFASSYTDGVKEMTSLFFSNLTDLEVSAKTFETYYIEFYGILRLIFDEFKKIKLTTD